MNIVTSRVLQQWSSLGTRKTGKGWISANAPCCVHNGESKDKRRRGNLLCTDDGGFVYHCFNCGFKTGWKPGRYFHHRARNLCSWMGMSDNDVRFLVFQAIRTHEEMEEAGEIEPEFVMPTFEKKPLPESFKFIDLVQENYQNYDKNFSDCLEYVLDRGCDLEEVDWRWSPQLAYKRRVIIPFTWQNEIIGYTARSVDSSAKSKYLNYFDSNYVYGYDRQYDKGKFVIVTEGIFDAIAVNGIAIMTNEINDEKVKLIESLNRKIIYLPDRDAPGLREIDKVLELGWNVSLPDWDSNIKDAADARQAYGKLYTIRSILESVHNNSLTVKIIAKNMYM